MWLLDALEGLVGQTVHQSSTPGWPEQEPVNNAFATFMEIYMNALKNCKSLIFVYSNNSLSLL